MRLLLLARPSAECCGPDLLVAVCRSYDRGHLEETARLQRLLDELISQIGVFPVPWGVRIGLL